MPPTESINPAATGRLQLLRNEGACYAHVDRRLRRRRFPRILIAPDVELHRRRVRLRVLVVHMDVGGLKTRSAWLCTPVLYTQVTRQENARGLHCTSTLLLQLKPTRCLKNCARSLRHDLAKQKAPRQCKPSPGRHLEFC